MEIEISQWVKRGNMLVNTECLDITDKDHVYNQIKNKGLNPEDYGVFHPIEEKFKHLSRIELIEKIIKLENELNDKEFRNQ